MDCRKKILIDTDIGDDIDDAFAILSAISLRFQIVGITTVFMNTAERARMTKKLLSLFDGCENIPVFSGEGTPLAKSECVYPHLCQYTDDLEREEYSPDGNDAVSFIAQCCEKYGKDLTIAAIGPFTNIAEVIHRYPDALHMADKVVIMGGAYYRQYADWNVMCDVEAAEIMFSSLTNLECIGADVTHRLIPAKELTQAVERDNITHPGMKYLHELYTMWKDANDNPPFILHDALVMHYIADNSLCTMKKGHIEVITDGAARGITLNSEAYSKAYMNNCYSQINLDLKASVAYEADVDKFGKNILNDISKYSNRGM